MPYQVTCNPGTCVAIPYATSRYTDDDGNDTRFYEHETKLYENGTVLSDDEISPVTLALYEKGDPHVRKVMRKLEDDEVAALDSDAEDILDPAENAFLKAPARDTGNPLSKQQQRNEAKRLQAARENR